MGRPREHTFVIPNVSLRLRPFECPRLPSSLVAPDLLFTYLLPKSLSLLEGRVAWHMTRADGPPQADMGVHNTFGYVIADSCCTRCHMRQGGRTALLRTAEG